MYVYLHSYCNLFIYYFISFFSLLSLLVSVFLIFFSSLISTSFFLLSHSSFIFASMGLINLFFSHSLPVGPLCRRRLRLEWVWSTLGFCLNGSGFRLDIGFGSDQPWEWETKKNHKAWVWEIWASSWWWPVAAPRILFRGVIKKF